MSDRALLLCDGGLRGNPGTAASAAVLVVDGEVVAQRAELIGHASAGEAEHGADPLEVRSDSQLAIAALRSTAPSEGVVDEVRAAAARFEAIRWAWHPRAAYGGRGQARPGAEVALAPRSPRRLTAAGIKSEFAERPASGSLLSHGVHDWSNLARPRRSVLSPAAR